MQIYVTRAGQQLGPFETEAVKAKLRDGSFTPADLAWHEGAPGWIPLSSIPGLVEAPVAPPPPPPPAAAGEFPPPPPPPGSAAGAGGFYPPPVGGTIAAGRPAWLLPAILGGTLLLLLVLGGIGGYFWMRDRGGSSASSQRSSSSNTVTTPAGSPSATGRTAGGTDRPVVPGARTQRFVNSPDGLDGKRASNYADFSFEYPANWKLRKGREAQYDTNFVEIGNEVVDAKGQRNVIETFNVGYLQAAGGGPAETLALAPTLFAQLEPQIAKGFPNYRKISQGRTKLGPYEAYELRAQALLPGEPGKSGNDVWLRIVLIPPPAKGQNGVSLFMISTSLAEGMRGIDDVGAKGGTATIANSFRLGK